jgi:N-acetylmuramoyl-L-alanine amidase-like protein
VSHRPRRGIIGVVLGVRLTRRSLLTALAGAGAAGLLRPRPTLAALPPVRVFDMWVGDLAAGTTTLTSPTRFDLVGVEWSGPPGARIELRTQTAPGKWGRWAGAGTNGHGPDVQAPGRVVGDPVWVGGAHRLQLRAPRDLRGVRLHLVQVTAQIGARAVAAALPLIAPALAAGPGQPPIIAREAWAQGAATPRTAPAYGAVRMAFVHHTENPNGYSAADVPAMLLAIFFFHRDVRGWNDIGYNFVVDLFGRVFEARAGGIDEPVIGAQAGGYNGRSTGVAVLGDFVSRPVSAPARRALAHLLAWKLSLHGVPVEGRVTVRVSSAGALYSRFPAGARVSLPRIAGHRDADSTDCPGDGLYAQLPALRSGASGLAGRPLRLTMAPGAGVPIAPGPVTLSGTLAYLDSSPLAGATVEVQERQVARRGQVVAEQTLAQAVTGPDGAWSLALPVAADLPLRAVYGGGPGLPATVSEPLALLVAPAVRLQAASAQLASGAPLELSGSVSPPRPRVLVVVWLVRPDGSLLRERVRSLRTSGGRFAASVLLPAPASYRCIAETPADPTNAAGASPAVDVTVGAASTPSSAAARPRRA